MANLSRRGFFRTAGIGAAALGVASAMPTSASAVHGASEPAGPDLDSGPLVAYVRDVRAGRISVMVGEREVLVTDKALARSLARAAS